MADKNSNWVDIRTDYIEEEGIFHVLHVDAWKTDDDDESGEVIAKLIGVNQNCEQHVYTSYLNHDARFDKYAQEAVKEGEKVLRTHLAALIRN